MKQASTPPGNGEGYMKLLKGLMPVIISKTPVGSPGKQNDGLQGDAGVGHPMEEEATNFQRG